MASAALTYHLEGVDPLDALPHVVHRASTALQQRADRYDGVRVERGCVMLAGTIDSRLVTVVIGRDAEGDALGLRVLVSERSGAIAAVATFPVVAIGATLLIARLGETRAHMGLGALAGAVLGVLAAYAAFRLAPRLGIGARDRSQASAAASALIGALRPALKDLGIDAREAPMAFAGLERGQVEEPFARALREATKSIAEKR